MPERPTWDETWVAVASAIAARSRCEKRQVGCVLVSADNREHWVGYNGPPAGFWKPVELEGKPDCRFYCPQGASDRGTLCVSVHAEINALIQSSRRGREGGTAYVTAAPCWKCALALANSGVVQVVSPPYEADRAHEGEAVPRMFRMSGIEWRNS